MAAGAGALLLLACMFVLCQAILVLSESTILYPTAPVLSYAGEVPVEPLAAVEPLPSEPPAVVEATEEVRSSGPEHNFAIFLCLFLRYNRKGDMEKHPLNTKQARNLEAPTFTRKVEQHHPESLSQHFSPHSDRSDGTLSPASCLGCHFSNYPHLRG